MPELSKAGSFSSGICFRTSATNGSKLIAGKRFAEGEKAQLLLPQGKFQEILMRKIKAAKDDADLRLGSRITGFSQTDGSVEVQIMSEDGNEEVVQAEYVVGADGAKSTVRKTMGLRFDGDTLPNQLVATDIEYDFHKYGFYDANFIIDAENYGLIGRITNDGLWRVSYGVPNSVSDEQLRQKAEDTIKRMLPDEGKSGFRIKRIAPYKAQQLCVDTFWSGRVGVCGDAAHCKSHAIIPQDNSPIGSLLKVTNPYAGLGLASGIADASSLAEVLVRILTQKAADPETLLVSWSQARRHKFMTVIDKPSRMAYNRVKKNVDTDEEIEALLAGDPIVGALKKGMPVTPPPIETRGEDLSGW